MIETWILNGWAASPEAWSLCRFERSRLFSYVEQLSGAPERAMEEAGRVVLVGWSMGGSGALRLAMQNPEKIAGLVLVAATPRMMKDDGWVGMTERRLAALQMGLQLTMGGGFFGVPEGRPNPYMTDSTENLTRGIEYLRATDLRAALREKSSLLANIPTEIFQSERDGIVRPSNADFLMSVFPRAKLHMVPGAEHALPVTVPELIDTAVARVMGSI